MYAASDLLFGQKREVNLDGRALYDTDTALELRDRLSALKGMPRALPRFSTEIHADVELGEVMTFAADVDTLQAYSAPQTDGSGAGKAFRVLEVHQQFGSSWHTELGLVDLTVPAT